MINKHEFSRSALEENSEIFVVHVAALEALKPTIHPSQVLLLVVLQQDKALTEILLDYAKYAEVFSPDLTIELPENSVMNEHAIELI